MTGASSPAAWAERAADRSPVVRRSRDRQIAQAGAIVDAARRLMAERGAAFTTQELVKEAGVALQTFYRLFGGKDQLILTLFEVMIAESCADLETRATTLPDPLARLHFYVTETVGTLSRSSDGNLGARFMTAEHWRLHQLFPDEMAEATQPFADLVARQLEAAVAAGLATTAEPDRSAWFITKLVMAVFHHYAYVDPEPDARAIGEDLWAFCRNAVGARTGPR
jgi:AcrR family transcriptional regulator